MGERELYTAAYICPTKFPRKMPIPHKFGPGSLYPPRNFSGPWGPP